MRYALLATTLVASPALALQVPTPGKDDPHICTVVYRENDVVDVEAVAGHTVAIRFGEHERIANDGTGHVTVSDEAHLRMSVAEGSNVLWLKSTSAAGMDAQPILVRTAKADGKPRDYVLQWTAAPLPPPGTPAVAQLASNGPVTVSEVSATRAPNVCYQITYLYPSDEVAAKAAAAAEWRAKKRAQEGEVALRLQQQATRNVRYTAQGDASIGPAEIFDDGMTTTLSFPGNLPIPVIYGINPDGTDSAAIGYTTEQGGVIRLHEVRPRLRLRQGDLVLCIFNHGYNPIGSNPGTGTTSSDVTRDVHE